MRLLCGEMVAGLAVALSERVVVPERLRLEVDGLLRDVGAEGPVTVRTRTWH